MYRLGSPAGAGPDSGSATFFVISGHLLNLVELPFPDL